jgi:DNA-directed RNA polymerase subunit RPC12/RpoP
MKSCNCTDCGANLSVDDNYRDFAFCKYCGAKIMLDDFRSTHRVVDQAKIKQAETAQMVKLKQLEMAEKDRANREKNLKLKLKISLILATVGILMMVLGFFGGNASGDSDSGFYMLALVGMFPLMGAAYIWPFSSKKENDDVDLGDKAKVPSSIEDFEKKNYLAIEAMLRSAGFTNIKCVPLGDLTIGVLKNQEWLSQLQLTDKVLKPGDINSHVMQILSFHITVLQIDNVYP